MLCVASEQSILISYFLNFFSRSSMWTSLKLRKISFLQKEGKKTISIHSQNMWHYFFCLLDLFSFFIELKKRVRNFSNEKKTERKQRERKKNWLTKSRTLTNELYEQKRKENLEFVFYLSTRGFERCSLLIWILLFFFIELKIDL